MRPIVTGTSSAAVLFPLNVLLAQLSLLPARHCHCQLRSIPTAITVKVAVLPSAAVTLDGLETIVGFTSAAL